MNATNLSSYLNIIFIKLVTQVKQEVLLMLTNPRDAYRGQSMSPNIVAFHMLGISLVSSCAIVTLSLRRAVFSDIRLQNVVTLKFGSEVTQGHFKKTAQLAAARLVIILVLKECGAILIDCMWFSISVL